MSRLVLLHDADDPPAGTPGSPVPDERFFLLKQGETKIGREPALVDVVLPGRLVSRVHARILQEGESYRLEDLSRNGTRVNGHPVIPGTPRLLRDRDRIQIGDHVLEFRAAVTIPGYEVLGELGRGGMGVVYQARQTARDRAVAIKMLLCGRRASPAALARFRVEAEAVACLAHPNIILIHEVGVWGGYPYLALEYAPGGSLAQKLQRQPQPPHEAAELVQTLAGAVQHAHQRGILHRDLKPANILLTAAGLPKVSDFGLAKFSIPVELADLQYATITVPDPVLFHEAMRLSEELASHYGSEPATEDACSDSLLEAICRRGAGGAAPDVRLVQSVKQFVDEAQRQSQSAPPPAMPNVNDLTRPGTIMGSPAYMAPEQARGDTAHIGPAVDVYQLGAILYEMLTGGPPFRRVRLADLLEDVATRPPVPPRQVVPAIPKELEAICLKCLDKRIEGRYPSAAALADDLQRFTAACPA